MTLGFVLVHGGAHASWCWERLIPYLDHPALAVDLPGRGSKPADLFRLTIADCVESVLDDIDSSGFDRSILVGHSMAGIIIPVVAARSPERVAHLCFLSASIPRVGHSSLDEVAPWLRWLGVLFMRRAFPPQGVPPHGIGARMLKRMFCSDMSPEDTAYVLDHIGPEAPGIVSEKVIRPELPASMPRIYIKLTLDKALAPKRQDRMIAHLGATKVRTLDAGHDAMISRPQELAKILNEIAREAASAKA